MEFAVGAGPDDRARVPDLVARLEQRHVRPDGRHHAGRVIAEDLWRLAALRVGALAHLVVDRIDRDRLHLHQQVAALRRRLFDLDIEQRLGLIDRQRMLVADGAHRLSLTFPFDRFRG